MSLVLSSFIVDKATSPGFDSSSDFFRLYLTLGFVVLPHTGTATYTGELLPYMEEISAEFLAGGIILFIFPEKADVAGCASYWSNPTCCSNKQEEKTD